MNRSRVLSALFVIALIGGCNADVRTVRHSDSTGTIRGGEVEEVKPVDDDEGPEYFIADTTLYGHRICVVRYTCSVRVIRDGKENMMEEFPYDSTCEWPGDQGVAIINQSKVRHANLFAIDSTEIYFGWLHAACRGQGSLCHCVLMPDGRFSLSVKDADSYYSRIVIDPVQRLWLTRNKLPDIKVRDSASEELETWSTLFYTSSLRTSVEPENRTWHEFRINLDEDLSQAFDREDPNDSDVLELHERFMR